MSKRHLTAQSNAEDWAARAKAWASAKAAMESQHTQAHYQNQYNQAVESHYVENNQNSNSGSAYQQYPVSATPPNGQPVHLQENQSIGSRSASYLPDGRMMYSATDGPMNGNPNAVFLPQDHLPAKQSAHQQEVPSSYSSVSGNIYLTYNLHVHSAQRGAFWNLLMTSILYCAEKIRMF